MSIITAFNVCYFAAILGNRSRMGIPQNWNTVKSWLDGKIQLQRNVQNEEPVIEKKFPKIPKLSDYNIDPSEDFWNYFPKRDLPNAIESAVNHSRIRFYLTAAKPFLTVHQWKRGIRLVDELENGAPSFQLSELPPVTVPNNQTALKYGEHLTDKIASWVDSGFVVGPFSCPPMAGFRANTLIATCRNNSVRPIINMSEPKGTSFNDNLNEKAMEKVWMSTAKSFSYKLISVGKNCLISKYDLKDAYKNIPARMQDWRLQGFKWGGKYFFETKMIFGASPSVANFDILGSTIVELAVQKCSIPRYLVSRALDDIPVLAPRGTAWTYKFSRALKQLCADCGIKLAENCPENKKAFEHQKKGTVLGIIFNSESMEWSLSHEKAEKLIVKVQQFSDTKYVDLKKTQGVMGSVNDLAQMAPFLKFFKSSGNKFLGDFCNNEMILKAPSEQMRKDLLVCSKVAESAKEGLPIAHRPVPPPLIRKEFFSDAAGAKFSMRNGERVNHSTEDDRGAASFEVAQNQVSWWMQATWPLKFINEARDSRGCYYGSKTSTLEAIGLLLLFLAIPGEMAGQNVILHVDNMSLVYGWDNGYVKNDEAASMFLKAISLISVYIGSPVYVEHVARCSDRWSVLADNLSRRSSTSAADRWLLRNARKSDVPATLKDWLRNPVVSWDLPMLFLEDVKNKLKVS
jgi:hypothetical protein